jgi:O-antigen ligase
VSMFPRLRIAPETTAWMTRPFVAATLLFGPLLGSAVSAAMVLAALLGAFQWFNNNYKITESRPQRLIFSLILAWFATEAIFGLLHFNGRPTMFEIAENLPFLGYIVFVSGMELSNKQDLRRIIHVWCPIAAFATLALASAQIQLGPHRAEGAAGNAGPFAALCLIMFSCCLLTAIETKGRTRILSAAGAVSAAACVMLSGMKGLWPALAAVPFALAIVHWRALKAASMRVFLAAALIILAVIVLTQGTIEKRLTRLGLEVEHLQMGSSEMTSLAQHVLIWQAGWHLLSEAPAAGHGLGRNKGLMAAQTSEMGSAPLSYSHFHNAILTQGVQSGVVGIAALLAMFFAPLALAWRRSADEIGRHGISVILAATIVYAISGATGIMFGHDLMDMGWIAAISYGSFMCFGAGEAPIPAIDASHPRRRPPAGSAAS